MSFKINYGKHIKFHKIPKGRKVVNQSSKICEDVYICDLNCNTSNNWSTISKDNHISRVDAYIDFSKDLLLKENFVILILESPHQSEYSPSLTKPLPAQGKTGIKICNYLIDVLNNSNGKNKRNVIGVNGSYKLALIESVNYQCSEGINIGDGKIRDNNWLKYYYRNGSINLVKKLDYFISNSNNNVIVINACTNSTNKHLQKRVEKTILSLFSSKIEYFSCQHPSSWFRSNVIPYLR